MKYDFTSMIDRNGWDALAIEAIGMGFGPDRPKDRYDFIPMWVADMNFPTAPAVTRELVGRAAHPLYGYFLPSEAYIGSILHWQKKRHGVEGLERRHIVYQNGVLGGLASALRAFTQPGEKILVHSPTYVGFTGVFDSTGRVPSLSPLVQDEAGIWRMDYADMERRLKEEKIHFAVFCSPHNPTGRVWEREEIEQAMALFARYDCIVVSDEIWSDLILPGHVHIPTQSVSEEARRRTVALYSPSKGFNLSGLVGSYALIYDPTIRRRMQLAADATHYNGMNVLSAHALVGAYSAEGEEWLEELVQVLDANTRLVCETIQKELPQLSVRQPEGTYLLFVNCRAYCEASGRSMDDVIHAAWDVGVGFQDGRPFHDPWAIRMNIALPTVRVQEALRRMKELVFI